MNNALLTVLILFSFIQIALFVLFLSKVHAVFREFLAFISPKAPDSPSPAAEVWASMAKVLITEFKMTLNGMMSVQSKAEKRVEAELLDATVAERSPTMAMALQAFPALRKLIMRNPALMDLALKKVAQIGAQAPSNGPGDHSGDSFADRLGRYG